MKAVIKRVGPCTIRKKRNHFQSLVWAIVGQQVSAAAAKTIFERLKDSFAEPAISAEALAQRSREQLCEIGLTRPKADYLLCLAEMVNSRKLKLNELSRKSDQQVIEELTRVKGIGTWTAQVFLIFSLGRLDVFPVDDIALQNAIRKNFDLGNDVSKQDFLELAESWAPYRSIASWYLWRTIHLDRDEAS